VNNTGFFQGWHSVDFPLLSSSSQVQGPSGKLPREELWCLQIRDIGACFPACWIAEIWQPSPAPPWWHTENLECYLKFGGQGDCYLLGAVLDGWVSMGDKHFYHLLGQVDNTVKLSLWRKNLNREDEGVALENRSLRVARSPQERKLAYMSALWRVVEVSERPTNHLHRRVDIGMKAKAIKSIS
jgi:hypothetical protein